MDSLLMVFTEMMMWGSLPILFGLSIWEHGLQLSRSNHILIQVFLILVVTRWAWFWFLIGEKQRFKTWLSANKKNHDPLTYRISRVFQEQLDDGVIHDNNNSFDQDINLGKQLLNNTSQLEKFSKQGSSMDEKAEMSIWYD